MNIEKDNTNVDLVNELADAYKNRLLQNKIDDEKIKKGNNKAMEIFADHDSFSEIAEYMPFYKNLKNSNYNEILSDYTSNKRKITEDDCCICFTSLKDTFTVTTNCNHNICFDCITKLKKKCCPLCRNEFPSEICKKLNTIELKKNPTIFNVQGIDSSFSWSGTPAAFNPSINYRN